MPTFRETLALLQEELAAEKIKKKNLEVLILQNKPDIAKLDVEDLIAAKELKRVTRELEEFKKENINLEAYLNFLKTTKPK